MEISNNKNDRSLSKKYKCVKIQKGAHVYATGILYNHITVLTETNLINLKKIWVLKWKSTGVIELIPAQIMEPKLRMFVGKGFNSVIYHKVKQTRTEKISITQEELNKLKQFKSE